MSAHKNKDNDEAIKDLAFVYSLVEDDLKQEYRAYRKKNGHVIRPETRITLRVFRKIVRKYLDICLKEAIDSLLGVEWFPRFGHIQVISKRFLKRIYAYRNYGNGWYKRYMNTEKNKGYFSYLKWHAPKRYKHGLLKLDMYYKKKISYNLYHGKEYLRAI